MSKILVFFLGFLAGSIATATTILIVVFGLNIFSGKSHNADYDDYYWMQDTLAVDECCVVIDDTTSIVWTEF